MELGTARRPEPAQQLEIKQKLIVDLSEVAPPLEYDYPVFRKSRGWLESERNPNILC
tara:strand:- start:356 stop:526 length:171 start_codon:yes stop_codon:yes gene_type:complete